MSDVFAISLDFETIFYLVVVVAMVAGPLIEQARKKKAKDATKPVDESDAPTPAPIPLPKSPAAEPDHIEIKLPNGMVIARIPRDRVERRSSTPPVAPPAPPISRPVARPMATSRNVSAPIQRQPEPARPRPAKPRRPAKTPVAADLRSHHLAKTDLTNLDDVRKIGTLAQADARSASIRTARRRAAINLRQAVVWSEIFRKPVALQDPSDRFVW